MPKIATLLAGVPQSNMTLYHRIRFSVVDSAVWIGNLGDAGESILLLRDIEMGRAKEHALVDREGCAADFVPEGGLSGDRDTALAQATIECLRRAGIKAVVTDRTLPFLFACHLQQAGVEVKYDPELGVVQRRVKDEDEIEALE